MADQIIASTRLPRLATESHSYMYAGPNMPIRRTIIDRLLRRTRYERRSAYRSTVLAIGAPFTAVELHRVLRDAWQVSPTISSGDCDTQIRLK